MQWVTRPEALGLHYEGKVVLGDSTYKRRRISRLTFITKNMDLGGPSDLGMVSRLPFFSCETYLLLPSLHFLPPQCQNGDNSPYLGEEV